jgi:hypothetical protein
MSHRLIFHRAWHPAGWTINPISWDQRGKGGADPDGIEHLHLGG